MDHICSPPGESSQCRDLETQVTYVIEVTDFKKEVPFDLRDCFEATVAPEVVKFQSHASLQDHCPLVAGAMSAVIANTASREELLAEIGCKWRIYRGLLYF